MKNRIALFAVFILLPLSLAACGGEEDPARVEGGIDNTIIETYVYLAEVSPLPHITNRIHGTLMHEGRIYFYYTETRFPDGYADDEALEPPVSTIVIECMLPDGTSVSRTEIPNAGAFIHIAGLRVTDEGNFALIFTDTAWAALGADAFVFYAQYTPRGEELVRREIPGLIPPGAGWFYVRQALFTERGTLLFAVTDRDAVVYLLDAQFSVAGRTEPFMGPAAPTPMTQTRDGRVIGAALEDGAGTRGLTLREFDLAAGDWGEGFPIAAADIRGLHPAREGDLLDLYINDGTYLFGYHLETGKKTRILNWTESRVSTSWDFQLNFLDDGRLSVLTGGGTFDDWHTEHTVLTRTARADLPDYEVITLGGVDISPLAREQVMAFNRQRQTHQIQVVDYFAAGGDEDDLHAAHQRFLADLMTGRAPDIIWGDPRTLAPVARAGLLLDLYTFIDADPALSRSDFIPSILALQEAADGSLPLLSNAWVLSTLIGMADTVGDIDAWTFAEMRALVEGAIDAGMESIIKTSFQDEIDAARFVERVLADQSLGFLNLAENTANLNSEAFLDVLELAAYLPRERLDWDTLFGLAASVDAHSVAAAQMRRGELLFNAITLGRISDFQVYRALVGDGLVFLGWPSGDSSGHIAILQDGLGISVASDHPDAAWEFVRRFLLPEAAYMELSPGLALLDLSLPLRAAILEDMISDAMTPKLEIDEDGDSVEVPRSYEYIPFTIRFTTDVYAMTEAEAQAFRAIVANTTIHADSLAEVIDIVREELLPFLAGDRSAADTARIMQNRAQTFLSERG